jgi:hypothetical protein
MLSKESCAAVLNAGSNLRVSGLPPGDLVEASLSRYDAPPCRTGEQSGFGD